MIFDFALCRRLEILSPCREDRGFWSRNLHRKEGVEWVLRYGSRSVLKDSETSS